jgi:SecD/SecF fusion protein
MRNRSGIITLTIIISLLCVYYLSFTLVANQVQDRATAYATDSENNVDYAAKQNYLDSVWSEPVHNLFGIQYTYQEVKETELNLGLDLRGGMHVTLEVSPVEIIKGISGNNPDPDFLAAIDQAREAQRNSQESFTTLFRRAFNEIAPEKNLSNVFANAANRGRISTSSSDNEVMAVINEEVDNAIDRAFNILRTRIDRFGTSQPNIQRLQNTGRIQIELPGVNNPERVRNLLQGVAKLEFLEVIELQEISGSLQEINNFLVAEQKANNPEENPDLKTDDDSSGSGFDDLSALSETEQEASTDTSASNLEDQLAENESDTASLDSALVNNQVSPLFSLLKAQYGLVYALEDTAAINEIISRSEVQDFLPPNVDLIWSVKPEQTADDGTQLMELYPVRRERGGGALLTGEVITDARQDFDERSQPAVSMLMNSTGARRWRNITANSINKRIAIVLDGFVYSAPVVQGEIPNGNSSISGNFTVTEAQDLANILEAGALPAPTRIVEEAIIGPTLGKEAQNQGIVSILSGLAIVVLFMISYYSKGGMIANLALLFNIFFILGILAQLNAALTLPGIAGIVLTIGMSIDANVLIFERIREELRNGTKIKAAIDAGYSKAYSSIVDSNATTFLTGLILYIFGQGPVKGFAVTLMIGIVSSFFSAVFITRVIVEWMSKRGEKSKMSFATPFSKNLFTGLNFDFVGKRKIAYIFSAVFISLGMLLVVTQGGLKLGVDFKGGRSYVLTFPDPVVSSELEVALDDSFTGAGLEVKTYGANNVLKVTTSYLIDNEGTSADEQVRDAMVSGVEEFTGLAFSPNDRGVDDEHFTISSSSKVGATIADDIRRASLYAVAFSLIVIFLYILIRFTRWQFSTGAIIALFHDVLFVISAFAIARLLGISYEVDQVFIAAMLTIVGYSINDTVIVFDRIRENLNARPGSDKKTIFNLSINNVMTRTLITSVTTLIVVLVLLIFGGEALRGFSFALLIGILVGTYSSVFIATPAVIDLSPKSPKKTKQAA